MLRNAGEGRVLVGLSQAGGRNAGSLLRSYVGGEAGNRCGE